MTNSRHVPIVFLDLCTDFVYRDYPKHTYYHHTVVKYIINTLRVYSVFPRKTAGLSRRTTAPKAAKEDGTRFVPIKFVGKRAYIPGIAHPSTSLCLVIFHRIGFFTGTSPVSVSSVSSCSILRRNANDLISIGKSCSTHIFFLHERVLRKTSCAFQTVITTLKPDSCCPTNVWWQQYVNQTCIIAAIVRQVQRCPNWTWTTRCHNVAFVEYEFVTLWSKIFKYPVDEYF